jgi:hypothetical protein
MYRLVAPLAAPRSIQGDGFGATGVRDPLHAVPGGQLQRLRITSDWGGLRSPTDERLSGGTVGPSVDSRTNDLTQANQSAMFIVPRRAGW